MYRKEIQQKSFKKGRRKFALKRLESKVIRTNQKYKR